MKKRVSIEQVYLDILMGHGSLSRNMTKLRYECDSRSMGTYMERLRKRSGAFAEAVERSLFPADYFYLQANLITGYQETSLERELTWGKNLICLYSDRLVPFFVSKRRFENLVMQGNYGEARLEMENIKQQAGCSLWSMEQEFLLCELEDGIEATKKFQNGLRFGCKTNWMDCFAHLYSLKVERNLNENQYEQRVKRILKLSTPEVRAYVQMHLMVEPGMDAEISWKKVLYYSSKSALVDYYFDFCKICGYLLCDKDETAARKGFIRKILTEIQEVLPSPILEKMIFPEGGISFGDTEQALHEIGIDYTEGNYDRVIAACDRLLGQDGSLFCAYEYKIKACIIAGKYPARETKEAKQPKKEPLQEWLLRVLYNVYRKEKNCEYALDEIGIFLRYLNGFSMAPELYHFYLNKVAYYYADFWKKNLGLHTPYHNLLNCRCYDMDVCKRYIQVFEDRFGSYALTQLYRLEYQEDVFERCENVEPSRLEWYRARILADRGQYKQAAELVRRLQEAGSLYASVYLKEERLLFLLEAQMHLGFYLDALEMLVHTYLQNRLMTMRIDKKEFYGKLKSHITDDIKASIAMPILSFIANRAEVDGVYVDFANFFERTGCVRPSEMLKQSSLWERDELIFFLRRVCTVDMMDSLFWVFENEGDVQAERLSICQQLKEFDEEHEKDYNDEISAITQKQILLQDIQYLDEQKIDFDMDKVHNAYLDKFSESFKRYREIGKIWQDIQQINVKTEQDNCRVTLIVFDESKENHYSVDKQNQKYNMFAELFFEFRDEIAFGTMGLDQSLGTRIRHGRLQNQIRHIFEERNMIFIRENDNSDRYIPIREKAFAQTFRVADMGAKRVQKLKRIITDFTKQMDGIVLEARTNRIRIRTEKDYPLGLIDMNYTENNDVWPLFQEGADLDNAQMMMELFEKDLLCRIREGLEALSNYFQGEVKTRCLEEIGRLDFRLKELYEGTELEESYGQLHNLLMQCRTELQKELAAISQWFKLSTTQEHPDYDMKTLLETCQATMRNINPSYDRANLSVENKTWSLWKGRTFSYFNEILTILFNNAFAHTGFKQNPEKLDISLNLEEDEWYLHLHVKTNLAEDIDIEDVRKRVLDVREEMNRQIDRFYGKDHRSGYIKIQNMLRTYISPEHNSLMQFGPDKPGQYFETYIAINVNAIKGSAK